MAISNFVVVFMDVFSGFRLFGFNLDAGVNLPLSGSFRPGTKGSLPKLKARLYPYTRRMPSKPANFFYRIYQGLGFPMRREAIFPIIGGFSGRYARVF
jgi:hypothetical protein